MKNPDIYSCFFCIMRKEIYTIRKKHTNSSVFSNFLYIKVIRRRGVRSPMKQFINKIASTRRAQIMPFAKVCFLLIEMNIKIVTPVYSSTDSTFKKSVLAKNLRNQFIFVLKSSPTTRLTRDHTPGYASERSPRRSGSL